MFATQESWKIAARRYGLFLILRNVSERRDTINSHAPFQIMSEPLHKVLQSDHLLNQILLWIRYLCPDNENQAIKFCSETPRTLRPVPSDSEIPNQETDPPIPDPAPFGARYESESVPRPCIHAVTLFSCTTVSKHWFAIAARHLWSRYATFCEIQDILRPFTSQSKSVSLHRPFSMVSC